MRLLHVRDIGLGWSGANTSLLSTGGKNASAAASPTTLASSPSSGEDKAIKTPCRSPVLTLHRAGEKEGRPWQSEWITTIAVPHALVWGGGKGTGASTWEGGKPHSFKALQEVSRQLRFMYFPEEKKEEGCQMGSKRKKITCIFHHTASIFPIRQLGPLPLPCTSQVSPVEGVRPPHPHGTHGHYASLFLHS